MPLEGEKIHHIHKIVLLTLDSLYSSVGLHDFVERFEGRVVLICASQRYGGKYGSFLWQFLTNLRRGGLSFVNYLSFHFVYFYPILYLFDFINHILRRPKKVYSIKQLARMRNIPLFYTKNPNYPDTLAQIEKLEPDLIVSAYFDHVIRKKLIAIPKFGIINVHTSLLPDFRGPFPSLWPLIHNEKDIGVTVHYINSEELDTGPILLQKRCRRIKGESVLGTDCRLFREGIELVKRVVIEIENGTAHAVNQEAKGRYFSFPKRSDLARLKKHRVPLVKLRDVWTQFF